ncbi:hypothetical protein L0F63_003517, partial [Massospora cicadina]
KDLIGTFVATDTGAHEIAEIHFGDFEVLIKKLPGDNAEHNLIRGHWYKNGRRAILEGTPNSEDKLTPFVFLSKNKVRYRNTVLVRAKGPTSLDTLVMVGYGTYIAHDSHSVSKSVSFTEGRMTMSFKNCKTKHGPWTVNKFDTNNIYGKLEDENNKESFPVHIQKLSDTSLNINCVKFDKKHNKS